jgi:Putative zinc-finger
MTDSTSGPHLSDSEMARYLDRRVSLEERDRIEDHLASCAECREHALGTQQLLRGARRPRVVVAGSVLAAAAAVILIWIARVEPAKDPSAQQLRGVASDNTGLIAYGPTGDAQRQTLRFVWGSAAGAASYRLSVTAANGAQAWSQSGVDTVATLPRSITLLIGERYLWVADAVMRDGSTRTTGLREFSLIP